MHATTQHCLPRDSFTSILFQKQATLPGLNVNQAMLAYGLLSYLDNSANTITDTRNYYFGENSPLFLYSNIFHSILAYSSLWY